MPDIEHTQTLRQVRWTTLRLGQNYVVDAIGLESFTGTFIDLAVCSCGSCGWPIKFAFSRQDESTDDEPIIYLMDADTEFYEIGD